MLRVIFRNQGTQNIGLNVLTIIITIIAIIPKCFTYDSAAPGKVLCYLGKTLFLPLVKIVRVYINATWHSDYNSHYRLIQLVAFNVC